MRKCLFYCLKFSNDDLLLFYSIFYFSVDPTMAASLREASANLEVLEASDESK